MEEVIIDGCNVAECKKYHKGWCLLSKTAYGNVTEFCNENPNCYFKQLQRAKAENERLKKEIDELSQKIDELADDLEKVTMSQNYYFKENEKLKKENDNLKRIS